MVHGDPCQSLEVSSEMYVKDLYSLKNDYLCHSNKDLDKGVLDENILLAHCIVSVDTLFLCCSLFSKP